MRDEKEERKKQARSNKQTRQSNTAHPCTCTMNVLWVGKCHYMYNYILVCKSCSDGILALLQVWVYFKFCCTVYKYRITFNLAAMALFFSAMWILSISEPIPATPSRVSSVAPSPWTCGITQCEDGRWTYMYM